MCILTIQSTYECFCAITPNTKILRTSTVQSIYNCEEFPFTAAYPKNKLKKMVKNQNWIITKVKNTNCPITTTEHNGNWGYYHGMYSN